MALTDNQTLIFLGSEISRKDKRLIRVVLILTKHKSCRISTDKQATKENEK